MARPRAWADLIWSAEIADGGNMAPLNVLADLGASPLDTITVTRLVGDIYVVPTLPIIALDYSQRIDVGIGVATESAFDIGVTAVPQPDISTEYPARGWLYVVTMWLFKINSTTHDDMYAHAHFDIRTMRKVDKGILYVAAGNNPVQVGGEEIRVGGRIRALCLT